MEQTTETITLDVEEINELAFKLKVEGAESPAKVRLVCENSDLAFMFNGRGTHEDGVVQFVIPQMKGKLQEGTYPARVEVLIDNRYFSPVQFQIQFKKTMQVFAESISVSPSIVKPEIRVSAAPIVVSQPSKAQPAAPRPVIIEKSVLTPIQVPAPKAQSNTVNSQKATSTAAPQASSQKSSGSTLKERFNVKTSPSEDEDDDLVRALARKLLSATKER